jgi:tetratricopeptide (TPR) repeat protein
MKLRPIILLAAALIAMSGGAFAHDGPEHEIEELTERIRKEGLVPDLLLQRAIEYNVVGDATNALKDLQAALNGDPGVALAHREYSRTLFALGRTNDALAAADKALLQVKEAPDRAALLVVRAEILKARQQHKQALADVEGALRLHAGDVDWYLLRSQLHAVLKMKDERVKGLEAGIRENGSGALHGEWIEALIDAGRLSAALVKIEAELKTSRLKSTWLIRRAKVRLASGKSNAAKQDLEAALAEINDRVRTGTPDAFLLADRATAYELLQRKDDALKDYEAARDKGLRDDWILDRIRALKSDGAADSPSTK